MAQRRTPEPPASPEQGFTILVIRSGGFAGLRQQWQVEPDRDPDLDADEWVRLVTACPWNHVGADHESRDRFVWRIEARMPPTVRLASVPDAQLVGPWRALVDRVRAVAPRG